MEKNEINTEVVSDSSSAPSLHVKEPSEPITKHSVYRVEGTDSSGQVESSRKYSEFVALREVLSKKWPGIPFPVLKQKKLISSNLPEEERLEMLQILMQEISSKEFIYSSDEFQLFLRGPEDFDQVYQGLSAQFKDISVVYQTLFRSYEESSPDEAIEEEILKFYRFIKESLKNLELIKKHVKGVMNSHQAFENNLLQLLNMLECVDDEVMSHHKKIEVKGYLAIYDWVKKEINSIQSMIEVIKQKQNLEALRGKLEDKVKSNSNELQKTQEGRFSISRMFNRNKDEFAKQLEEQIENNGEDIHHLGHITRIITYKLYQDEIPKFTTLKQQRYQKMIQVFADSSIRDFKSLIDFIQFKFNDQLI